jgi:hypothetical protein
MRIAPRTSGCGPPFTKTLGATVLAPRYGSGGDMNLGDVVRFGPDSTDIGRIVVIIATGQAMEGHTTSEWELLGSGIVVNARSKGLMHCKAPYSELTFMRRARFIDYLASVGPAIQVKRWLISLPLAMFLTGFAVGMIFCIDCSFNPFSYLFIGAIHGLLTLVNLGFLWLDANRMTNAWPYIAPLMVGIYLTLQYRAFRIAQKCFTYVQRGA